MPADDQAPCPVYKTEHHDKKQITWRGGSGQSGQGRRGIPETQSETCQKRNGESGGKTIDNGKAGAPGCPDLRKEHTGHRHQDRCHVGSSHRWVRAFYQWKRTVQLCRAHAHNQDKRKQCERTQQDQ